MTISYSCDMANKKYHHGTTTPPEDLHSGCRLNTCICHCHHIQHINNYQGYVYDIVTGDTIVFQLEDDSIVEVIFAQSSSMRIDLEIRDWAFVQLLS